MAWTVAYACDICGKQKGEANHWWMARLSDTAEAGGTADPEAGGVTLLRWSKDASRNGDVYHLCGQRCAPSRGTVHDRRRS